jgi:hypothetical protein
MSSRPGTVSGNEARPSLWLLMRQTRSKQWVCMRSRCIGMLGLRVWRRRIVWWHVKDVIHCDERVKMLIFRKSYWRPQRRAHPRPPRRRVCRHSEPVAGTTAPIPSKGEVTSRQNPRIHIQEMQQSFTSIVSRHKTAAITNNCTSRMPFVRHQQTSMAVITTQTNNPMQPNLMQAQHGNLRLGSFVPDKDEQWALRHVLIMSGLKRLTRLLDKFGIQPREAENEIPGHPDAEEVETHIPSRLL